MQSILFDLRFALRMLIKNPGFTCIAVFALALGTGVNTAIFSVVDAVLLRQLPFPTASRLVAVNSYNFKRVLNSGVLSCPDFHDFRERNHSFENMTAVQEDRWALIGPGREPADLRFAIVSANMFPMLDVKPLVGRTFRPEEDEDKTGPMAVVLSESTWRKYFGGDMRIIGSPVTIQRQPYEISPTDPLTLTAITLVVLSVTFLASYIPARRAARVDPLVTLRYE